MTLNELVNLYQAGRFHHATYRDHGTVWEGLHIYETSNSPIGYKPAGLFGKNDTDLLAAENFIRHTGISVGSFR